MFLNMLFDKTVEVTATQKTIDSLTLLTRLGGATGVGKEIIWFILLLVDLLVIFNKQIHLYKKPNVI